MNQQLEMSSGTAPATAAATPQAQQQGELHFLRDGQYAFHGEIMMLALFAVFFVFICFVAVLPCVRRLRKQAASSEDSSNNATEALPPPPLLRRNDDHTTTSKFPSQLLK